MYVQCNINLQQIDIKQMPLLIALSSVHELGSFSCLIPHLTTLLSPPSTALNLDPSHLLKIRRRVNLTSGKRPAVDPQCARTNGIKAEFHQTIAAI